MNAAEKASLDALAMIRDLERKALEDVTSVLKTTCALANMIGGAPGALMVLRSVLDLVLVANATTYRFVIDETKSVEPRGEDMLAVALLGVAFGVAKGGDGMTREELWVKTAQIMSQFRKIAGSEMPIPPEWRRGGVT